MKKCSDRERPASIPSRQEQFRPNEFGQIDLRSHAGQEQARVSGGKAADCKVFGVRSAWRQQLGRQPGGGGKGANNSFRVCEDLEGHRHRRVAPPGGGISNARARAAQTQAFYE